jgi:hypothetical protein
LSLHINDLLIFCISLKAKVAQLKYKLKQISKQSKKDAAAAAEEFAKKHRTEHQRSGMSSGSDIISAMLQRNTPKRTSQASERSVRDTGMGKSPSAVMIRSMAGMAHKVLEEQRVASEAASQQATNNNEIESYDFEADQANGSYEEESAVEPAAVSTPPPVAPAPTRQMVANTLKSRVSAAINYQLLDILNNGTSDEVCLMYVLC